MPQEPCPILKGSMKIVVVGAGHWGQVHLKRWSELLGRPVDLVVDPYPPQSTLFRRWRNHLDACSHDELQDALVVIATPIIKLYEVACYLIQARVAGLFIEKPGAMYQEQLLDLHIHAQKLNLKIAVGYIERFNGAFQPIFDSFKDWWNPSENSFFLKITRSSRKRNHSQAPISLDLWCHDLNLLQYLLRQYKDQNQLKVLWVNQYGQIYLKEQVIGAMCTSDQQGIRRWEMGSQSYDLNPWIQMDSQQLILDPLSLECIAFARWVIEDVWSDKLCSLEEAIDSLSALPPFNSLICGEST